MGFWDSPQEEERKNRVKKMQTKIAEDELEIVVQKNDRIVAPENTFSPESQKKLVNDDLQTRTSKYLEQVEEQEIVLEI